MKMPYLKKFAKDKFPTLFEKLRIIKKLVFKCLFQSPTKLMVNIGGGHFLRKGWSVLEYQSEWYRHRSIFIDYWYDLTSFERMPFRNDSVYLFYSEHTFEHISDECCQYIFSEIYRCLRPGGAVRIVVPDMDLAYNKYGAENNTFFNYWMEADNATFTEAFLILFAHPRINVNEDEVKHNYENMEKEDFFDYYSKPLRHDPKRGGRHINWYNFSKLKYMLENAGFKEIYKSSAQASRFEEMRGEQFDTRPWWSIHVEAIK